MRRLTLCCSVLVLAACSKAEQKAASLSYADIAGRWAVKTMAQGSDSVLVSFEMVAGADSTGWAFHFPNREPVPVQVLAMGGDSVVTHAGPYASVLRPGVQVTVHSVLHVEDGKLAGTSIATYSAAGADSVVTLRTEGTRVP